MSPIGNANIPPEARSVRAGSVRLGDTICCADGSRIVVDLVSDAGSWCRIYGPKDWGSMFRNTEPLYVIRKGTAP